MHFTGGVNLSKLLNARVHLFYVSVYLLQLAVHELNGKILATVFFFFNLLSRNGPIHFLVQWKMISFPSLFIMLFSKSWKLRWQFMAFHDPIKDNSTTKSQSDIKTLPEKKYIHKLFFSLYFKVGQVHVKIMNDRGSVHICNNFPSTFLTKKISKNYYK